MVPVSIFFALSVVVAFAGIVLSIVGFVLTHPSVSQSELLPYYGLCVFGSLQVFLGFCLISQKFRHVAVFQVAAVLLWATVGFAGAVGLREGIQCFGSADMDGK